MAALLNASHPLVNYFMSESAVIDAVNEALASLDRGTILALKDVLDRYNNQGCPIDAQGRRTDD